VSEAGEAKGDRTGLSAVVGSWRLLSVVLLSFASGLPLGLVWIAIPAWLAREGVDIKVIGCGRRRWTATGRPSSAASAVGS
jgi:PAT family beta-lactamase induction signal transducer AmpG